MRSRWFACWLGPCCSFLCLLRCCIPSHRIICARPRCSPVSSDPNAKGWIANYDVHPVETHDETFEFDGKAHAGARVFARGVGFAPGIVVVHGMHELGINEPRLVSFARSLAASGSLS